ncbi:hypothetical protein HDU88_004405 [Geranomyces variabilis]|nr:hypothetical protein HDU88_004405 [Geranomyces variabilis]
MSAPYYNDGTGAALRSEKDDLVLQPSATNPGDIDIVPASSSLYQTTTTTSSALPPSSTAYSTYEPAREAALMDTAPIATTTSTTYAVPAPASTELLIEDSGAPAHQATLGETLSNAAASVKSVAGQAANMAASATRSATEAVNQSGAIPMAKNAASTVASSAISGAKAVGNAASNATNSAVAAATAPSTSTSTVPTTAAPITEVTEISIPPNATIVVPRGTVVVEEGAPGAYPTNTAAPVYPASNTTAGDVASNVASNVAAAAGAAKNAAVNATNKLFGAGTTDKLAATADNASAIAQEKAIGAKEYVAESMPSRLPTTGEVRDTTYRAADQIHDTSYATAPQTTGVLADAKNTVVDASANAANAARDVASNAAATVRDTAAGVQQSAIDQANAAREAGVKSTGTSILAKVGSVIGATFGALAGSAVATEQMAVDAAATAIGRGPVTTEGVVMDIPGETILEESPRERGVLKAHEIERAAADVIHRTQDNVNDKTDRAVTYVATSEPVVATTTSARRAFDAAEVNTFAAGTLVGDAAKNVYNAAAGTAHTAAEVTRPARETTAAVASTAYTKAADSAAYAADATTHAAVVAKDATVSAATTAKDVTVGAATTVGSVTYNAATAAKDATVNTAVAAKDATVNTAAAARDVTVNTALAARDATVNTAIAAKDLTLGAATAAKDATVNTAVAAKDATVNTAVAAKNATVGAANTTASVAGNTYNKAADTASSAYNTTAATASSAADATKRAVGLKTTNDAHDLPEAHLGSPAGIAGPYGSSVPSTTTGTGDLTSDSALSAVFLPSDQRTPAQQAAIDEAMNRSLPSSTDATFSPTADVLSSMESAPVTSTVTTTSVTSVLPADLTNAELAAPPTDRTSTRSMPTSSIEERFTSAPATHEESSSSAEKIPTYEEQRATLPSSRHVSNEHLHTTTPVEQSPAAHHGGLMDKIKGRVDKILHKDAAHQRDSEAHRVAPTAEQH